MVGKLRQALPFLVALVAVALFLWATGIGCPIKFVTGISCPGCGMTRAWLSALRLDFSAAFSYHPLFLLVPVVFLVWLLRQKMGKRAFNVCVLVLVLALLGVWVFRLVTPGDVVSIDAPRWLAPLQHFFS